VSLEEQLMPGTLEYAIHNVVEERLDLSMFERRYCNDETGRKAINPKVLIKIVLFGYSRGLISSYFTQSNQGQYPMDALLSGAQY
jgi:transposase